MKTEFELRHLRTLVTVVETGSHTRAARQLGVSQSTVSETLAALERGVGTALFVKAVKGPALTPAGEVVLGYAQRILTMIRDLAAELATVSTEVNARLVVGAVESISAYVLPEPLAALRARWPNARFEVITGTCNEIRERVATGKCNVGLLLESDTGTAADPVVARTRFVVFGTSTHQLAGMRASPGDLRRCDFYMCDAGGNFHDVLRAYFEAAELPVPRTQAMGSIEGVKRSIAVGGSALGLLPAHAVARELRDGALVEIDVAPALPALVMRAVCASAECPSAMVDELLDRLRSAPLAPA